MQNIYTATIFAGALVCLLASLLLLVRRKTGDRSRIILAAIVFFSVINYITRFITLCKGDVPEFIVSAKMLLLANFMVLSYIMYPIEVISPGWLNCKNILKIWSVWIFSLIIYFVTIWSGVQYIPYESVIEMIQHAGRFDVWFRILLILQILMPGFLIFFINRTRGYSNTDNVWMRKYSITLFINIVAYILVLTFNHSVLHIIYYYVSVGCSLYIVYMELFDRLTGKIVTQIQAVKTNKPYTDVIENKKSALKDRLDEYIRDKYVWRDPDLTLNTLASQLFTNRTTLAKVIRDNGYENYTNYINKLRVEDFIKTVETEQSINFQEAFFFAGFRSRSTALRNFRQITGMTPSEFFLKRGIAVRDDNFN